MTQLVVDASVKKLEKKLLTTMLTVGNGGKGV